MASWRKNNNDSRILVSLTHTDAHALTYTLTQSSSNSNTQFYPSLLYTHIQTLYLPNSYTHLYIHTHPLLYALHFHLQTIVFSPASSHTNASIAAPHLLSTNLFHTSPASHMHSRSHTHSRSLPHPIALSYTLSVSRSLPPSLSVPHHLHHH